MSRRVRRISIPQSNKMLVVTKSNNSASIMMLPKDKYTSDSEGVGTILSPVFIIVYSVISLIATIIISTFNEMLLNEALWLFAAFMSVVVILFINDEYIKHRSLIEELTNTSEKNYTKLFSSLQPPRKIEKFDVIYDVEVADYSKAVDAPLEYFDKSIAEIAEYYLSAKTCK